MYSSHLFFGKSTNVWPFKKTTFHFSRCCNGILPMNFPPKAIWAGVAAVLILAGITLYFAVDPESAEPAPAIAVVPEASPTTKKVEPLPELPPTTATSQPRELFQETELLEQDDGDLVISGVIADESISHPEAARKLISLLPKLSEEKQEEAAHHIVNLSDETVVAEWADALAKNTLPAATSDVFFAELHNQPNEVLLQTAAAIAIQPEHPLQQESTELLEFLVGPLAPNETWPAAVARQLQEEKEQNQP